jgi:hypothetical protein
MTCICGLTAPHDFIPMCVQIAMDRAIKAEREACAQVCESFSSAEYATGKVDHNEQAWTDYCADAIRARGEAK